MAYPSNPKISYQLLDSEKEFEGDGNPDDPIDDPGAESRLNVPSTSFLRISSSTDVEDLSDYEEEEEESETSKILLSCSLSPSYLDAKTDVEDFDASADEDPDYPLPANLSERFEKILATESDKNVEFSRDQSRRKASKVQSPESPLKRHDTDSDTTDENSTGTEDFGIEDLDPAKLPVVRFPSSHDDDGSEPSTEYEALSSNDENEELSSKTLNRLKKKDDFRMVRAPGDRRGSLKYKHLYFQRKDAIDQPDFQGLNPNLSFCQTGKMKQ